MIERKYLAHYLDSTPSAQTTAYVRIGKDLEEYNDNLNPDVEVIKNILGEQNVRHKGYEVSGDVAPWYSDYDDALSEIIWDIINERKTGDDCKTTMVDVLIKPGVSAPSVEWAYREDVYIVPTTAGGDTSGVQTPITLYRAGNRVAGTFNLETKVFTPAGS